MFERSTQKLTANHDPARPSILSRRIDRSRALTVAREERTGAMMLLRDLPLGRGADGSDERR